jgi:hypothetical protein
MSTLTNIESMNLIYKYLERNQLLIEFLYRVENGILAKHISDDIIINNQFPGYENIETTCRLEVSNSFTQPDIYVYIRFIYRQTKNIIGHISLHMIKKTINNPAKEDGPLHIVNDRSGRRRQRIRVSKRVENNINMGLVFSVGGCVYHKCEVEEPMPQSLDILNKYFNPSDELSLSNNIKSDSNSKSNISYLNSLVKEILKSYNIRKRGDTRSCKISKQKNACTRKLK